MSTPIPNTDHLVQFMQQREVVRNTENAPPPQAGPGPLKDTGAIKVFWEECCQKVEYVFLSRVSIPV